MNISRRLVKVLAAAGDKAAERIYDACDRLESKHDVSISWANDGLGFIITVSPKPEAVMEDIENRFFNGCRSFSAVPAF